eukprot:7804026-Heterocapsa_arctica.AAC.1
MKRSGNHEEVVPDRFGFRMFVDSLLKADDRVVELRRDAVGLEEVLRPPSLRQPQPLAGLIGAVL